MAVVAAIARAISVVAWIVAGAGAVIVGTEGLKITRCRVFLPDIS